MNRVQLQTLISHPSVECLNTDYWLDSVAVTKKKKIVVCNNAFNKDFGESIFGIKSILL